MRSIKNLIPLQIAKLFFVIALPTIGVALLTSGCRSVFDDKGSHRSANFAVANLDLYPGLEATLFSSEPMMLSPTNLDVDHLGRVWVIDVVNYRGHAKRNERPDGDRILILEDENNDGQADSSKVFYQGRDIDAALGIAVLGDKVIVTAAPNIIVFTDKNGDDIPDSKQYLFTNTGLPQDDHSTHSVSFGPDGNLYWNMGNNGLSVHDKNGQLVIDSMGNAIIDRVGWRRIPNQTELRSPLSVDERPQHIVDYEDFKKPYIGGMVFRSSLDGNQTQTVAHNFRNNYEVAVDSLGSMWQSDNDDDGNSSCRINYILEFGNYGYRDEVTASGWGVKRIGQDEDVTKRHWHQNDPGVVPNLLITGAGAPAGITVYEGSLLPNKFRNQVLHADAGPGVVRAILSEKQGAGFTATEVNIFKGERDKWVRPVDVAVAPDGSLFVSDWYDPVVGWNRQIDAARGRIFRIAPKDQDYRVPEFNFETIEGAIEALRSPTHSVRYLAWLTLNSAGVLAEKKLSTLFEKTMSNQRLRARALWLLTKIKGREEYYINHALSDPDEDIRIVAIRAARQTKINLISLLEKLVDDPSPQVRREVAIALKESDSPKVPELWAELAIKHDGKDRWYLEALGIAADGRWDSCLQAWLLRVGEKWRSPAGWDIIWRSRASQTPVYLSQILSNTEGHRAETRKYLRAFDFQTENNKKSRVLRQLAIREAVGGSEKSAFVASEALLRISNLDLSTDTAVSRALSRILPQIKGTEQFARLVQRFQLVEYYPELMDVAVEKKDEPVGIESIKILLETDNHAILEQFLNSNPSRIQDVVDLLGNTRSEKSVPILKAILTDDSAEFVVREKAVRSLARVREGAEVLVGLAREKQFPEELKETAGMAMTRLMHVPTREEAATLFPMPPMKNSLPIPSMTDLLVYEGDPDRGSQIFETAGCNDCHVVNGQGVEFGPDLSGVGGKLARQGLYEAIFDPSAGISPTYKLRVVTLKNNEQVEGFVVDETRDKLTLRMEGGVTLDYEKEDVANQRVSMVSAMPADLQNQITLDELVDLVEYLTTLQ